ncbi:MAG TPA: UvrD-helicase domain-containing protein [Burkholderiaceae bacterium]|jgi:ATP-dependent helicase/nuclease subunit A
MSRAAYTINGSQVEPQAFYRVACDPARSVVVEACAGAGKTWMLVSRILRALLAGSEPQEIVAITFTRKAAGEMRQRLQEWLAAFAAATPAQRVQELRYRGMSEAEAQAAEGQLATLHARLLRSGRMVEIRTFHAWFAQLLRAAPLELLQAQNIAPELQLLEDEADLLPELWQRFNAAVQADEQLLADYRALVFSRGRNVLQDWLLAGFSKRVELRLAQAHGVLLDSMPDASSIIPGCTDPMLPFEAMRADLLDLSRQLGQAKGVKAQKAAQGIEQGIADFSAVYQALFTKTDTPLKGLGDSPEQNAICDRLALIRKAIQQQEAWLDHRRMVGLTLALTEQFDALKHERGLVDMNDLERGALALLGDSALAGWVQQRLDAQVRHLLIDEFQDTSPLQWHALKGWLDGYAGAGGGRGFAVFIVGDPKQSIYRFRRAEPRVFAAARDFVAEAFEGAVLACDHTRRNAQSVLVAVNDVFAEVDGFRVHTSESADEGRVLAIDVPFVEKADSASREDWRPSLTEARVEPELARRAEEARYVSAAIVQMLADGRRPGEIFVLARKREPLRVLAQALKAAGVPHAAPEDQALLDAPDVRDLLALLDVLASSGHDLSLAHALRSPLFGVGEADLLRLARESGSADWLGVDRPESRQTWWNTLHALEDGVSEELKRARALLFRWAALCRESTPHELLDAILHEGDLLARLSAAVPSSERRSRLHAVQALLELALDLDGGRYASIYGFVRALKKRALKLPLPAEPDAVQLLTVHGAKGLEAPVVFLLDGDAGPARAETNSLLIDWPVGETVPQRVAFLASEARVPPALQTLLDDERGQREREELNALYVAMTRARSRLVVSRTVGARAPSSPTWWSRLQPLAEKLTPQFDAQSAIPEATAPLRELPVWTPPAHIPREPQGKADDEAQAKLGESIHRVLEWASQPTRTRPALNSLMAAAAQMYGLDQKARERMERAVTAILQSPQCAPFFLAEQLRWAGNEVPLSLDGADMRLDRLVCLQETGEWWVLDYKLGSQPEARPEYLEQLRRYVAAVQVLQPGEPVRAALISAQGRLVDCTALL